jgi:hypothetical protein
MVSHWPLTIHAQGQFQASPCGICGRQSGTGACFSLSTLVSTVSIIPTMIFIIGLYMCACARVHAHTYTQNVCLFVLYKENI